MSHHPPLVTMVNRKRRRWQWSLPLSVAAMGGLVAYIYWQAAATDLPAPERKIEVVSGHPSAESPSHVIASALPELVSSAKKAAAREHREAIDPRTDNWESEAFVAQAEQGINELLSFLSEQLKEERDAPSSFGTPGIRVQGLSLPHMGHVADNGDVRVQTLRPASAPAIPLERAVTVWREWLDGNRIDRVAIKTTGIEIDRATAETRHEIELTARPLSGGRESPSAEHHATWVCHWDTSSEKPSIRRVDVLKWEATTTRTATRWFRDETSTVLGESGVYHRQLKHGLNHWLTRIPKSLGINVFAEYGMAIGDVNGDGLEDLYICQPSGLPNRLLLHRPDHTLADHSQESGVDWLDHSSSSLLVDLDNDGDQDLAIALENKRIILMQNDGRARFRVAANLMIEDRHVQGLSAADYDLDGDLDIYLTVGFADENARPGEPRPDFVYHDANEGGANVLFRNDLAEDDAWSFTDVTDQVGLDVNNRRHSLAAAWEDFDLDGDQDLYVANDYGKNCLYRNDGGRFTEIAPDSRATDSGSGMSVAWADIDRDGLPDLHVGNMFSSAGSRITGHPKFAGQVGEKQHILRRFVKGNTLFRNLGDGTFADIGQSAGVEMGRWAWSSVFADINNDGWDDIFVANGYITNPQADDL